MAEKNSYVSYINYVEPNYTTSINNGKDGSVIEMQPSLEDMCVCVNMAVEVPNTQIKGNASKNNRLILMGWNGETVNFLGGTTINPRNKKEKNDLIRRYLTTDYTNATFDDIRKGGTNEMFGISSIDIQYADYNTPQITVEFVDIRGISLFAPEELSHPGVAATQDLDIAGSFFRCFFTYPYPVFYISVKGVYGEPVCYEVTCSDFRARFDSQTGNFNATAKFIGYAFSLLSDITLNALVAAPLCNYHGREYWNKRVAENAFVDGSEGKPLPTLMEIIKNYQNIGATLSQIESTSSTYQLKKAVDDKLHSLNVALSAYNYLFKTFQSKVGLTSNVICCGVNQINPITISYENEGVIYLSPHNTNTFDLNTDANFKNALEAFQKATNNENVNISSNLLEFCTKKTKLISVFVKGSSTVVSDDIPQNHKSTIAEIQKIIAEEGCTKTEELETYEYGYYFNGANYLRELMSKITDYTQKSNMYTQDLNNMKSDVARSIIGCEPTVYNITKILMAHLETLMHCIYKCQDEVLDTNRTEDSMNFTTYVKIMDSVCSLGGVKYIAPFPELTCVSDSVDGTQELIDAWMGDVTDSPQAIEVEFIEELLNSVYEVEEEVNEVSGATTVEEVPNSLSMEYPITPLDLTLTKPIWGDIDSDITSIVGAIGLRAMTVLGLYPAWSKGIEEKMGEADALNFMANVKNTGYFKNSAFSTENFHEDIIAQLQSNNWDGKSLIKAVTNNYMLNISENGALPIQNITFTNKKEGVETNDSNQVGSNAIEALYGDVVNLEGGDYIPMTKKNEDSGYDGKRLFIIEKDYKRVEQIIDNIYSDKEEWEDIKEKFESAYWSNTSYDEYYWNDSHTVARTFQSQKKTEENLTYTPCQESGLFPLNREGLKDPNYTNDVFSGDYGNWMMSDWRVNRIRSNDNGKCIEIKNGGDSTHALIKEWGNEDKFTIPLFNSISLIKYKYFGGIEGGRPSNGQTLFGQSSYYDYTTIYDRAAAYLRAMVGCTQTVNNEVDGLNVSKIFSVIKEVLDSVEKKMAILPYQSILLCGAYLWCFKNQYTDDAEQNKRSIAFQWINNELSYQLYRLTDICEEVQNSLIREFTSWAEDDVNGFKAFANAFELTKPDGTTYTSEDVRKVAAVINAYKTGFWDNVKKLFGGKVNTVDFKWSDFLYDNFGENVINNYISFSYGDGKHHDMDGGNGIRLINRETSPFVKKALSLLMQPCIVYQTEAIIPYHTPCVVDYNKLTKYLKGFINKIKEINETSSTENRKSNTLGVKDTSSHIKCGLYKYIKVIYDKWLRGNVYNDSNHWDIEKFFEPHFHFLDTFYNYKTNTYCDIDAFYKRLVSSQAQDTYSLLDFMSAVYADNKFMFHCVQNFLDFNNVERMQNMFKPFSYHETSLLGLDQTYSDFVVMQRSEPSKRLNMAGVDKESIDDSFNLNPHTANEYEIPVAITSKSISHRPNYLPKQEGDWNGIYKVPCFGVSYGRQYQSYFTDISVSMDNPIVTEQSLKAQMAIVSMGKNTNDNPSQRQVWAGGQDLYSVYANNSYTCTVKMLGCAWIQPLMYFTLLNIPMFRGAYLIQKVTHNIKPGTMETTFVGTRMANKSLPTVNELYVGEGGITHLNQGVVSQQEDEKKASFDNNCKYKVFYSLKESGNGVSEEFLNKTIAEIQRESGKGVSEKNDSSKWYKPFIDTYKDETLLDALACTLYYEAVNQDNLGKQLVATTLYNRYKYGGLEWWVFGKSQTAWYGKELSTAISVAKKYRYYNELQNIIKHIWVNTPSVLVGTEVTPDRNVPIYNNNQKTNNVTKAKKLTLHDVQTALYYCTTDGYDKDGACADKKPPCESQNEFSPWWGGEYLFHHKGHVFNGDKGETWKYEPKNASQNNSEETAFLKLKGIVRCIEQTCQYSENLGISGVTMHNLGEDWMIITATKDIKSDELNNKLFDVVLNAYSDRLNQIYWITKDENSCADNAYGVFLGLIPMTTGKRSVGVVKGVNGKAKDSRYVSIIDSVDGNELTGLFNTSFYRSLYKKYGVLNKDNIKTFKSDVHNYNNSNMYGKYANHIDVLNGLFNKYRAQNCFGGDSLDVDSVDGNNIVTSANEKANMKGTKAMLASQSRAIDDFNGLPEYTLNNEKYNDDNVFKWADELGCGKAFNKKATPNFPWCAVFVSNCYQEAGMDATRKSTAARNGWYKMGSRTNQPIPGDVLCDYSKPNASHVGIFVSRSGNTVTSIEGNYSDKVSVVKRNYGNVQFRHFDENKNGNLNLKIDDTNALDENESTI